MAKFNELLQFGENKDENCRLQNSLNINCLLEVFQYLDTDGLLTLGTMNDFYKKIINNYLIRNHLVTLRSYGDDLSKYRQLFEMYGKKITRISFAGNTSALVDLFDFIISYCGKDQLKEIDIWYYDSHDVDSMKIVQEYFRKVEIFTLDCSETAFQQGFVHLLKNCNALHSLKLVIQGDISKLFSWPGMLNLRKLELVFGQINERTFIEFIEKQPKLEHFCTNRTFEHIDGIGNALAKYCGNQIRVFHFFQRNFSYDSIQELLVRYDFLAKCTNLKTIILSAGTRYGVDLHRTLVALSKNNTLENLIIDYGYNGRAVHAELDIVEMSKIYMNRFTSLKSVEIRFPCTTSEKMASASNFLKLNALEMMPNVKDLYITGFNLSSFNFAFLQNVPNLEHLYVNNQECISQNDFTARIMKSFELENKTNQNVKVRGFFKVTTQIRCFQSKKCKCIGAEASTKEVHFPIYA